MLNFRKHTRHSVVVKQIINLFNFRCDCVSMHYGRQHFQDLQKIAVALIRTYFDYNTNLVFVNSVSKKPKKKTKKIKKKKWTHATKNNLCKTRSSFPNIAVRCFECRFSVYMKCNISIFILRSSFMHFPTKWRKTQLHSQLSNWKQHLDIVYSAIQCSQCVGNGTFLWQLQLFCAQHVYLFRCE